MLAASPGVRDHAAGGDSRDVYPAHERVASRNSVTLPVHASGCLLDNADRLSEAARGELVKGLPPGMPDTFEGHNAEQLALSVGLDLLTDDLADEAAARLACGDNAAKRLGCLLLGTGNCARIAPALGVVLSDSTTSVKLAAARAVGRLAGRGPVDVSPGLLSLLCTLVFNSVTRCFVLVVVCFVIAGTRT